MDFTKVPALYSLGQFFVCPSSEPQQSPPTTSFHNSPWAAVKVNNLQEKHLKYPMPPRTSGSMFSLGKLIIVEASSALSHADPESKITLISQRRSWVKYGQHVGFWSPLPAPGRWATPVRRWCCSLQLLHSLSWINQNHCVQTLKSHLAETRGMPGWRVHLFKKINK